MSYIKLGCQKTAMRRGSLASRRGKPRPAPQPLRNNNAPTGFADDSSSSSDAAPETLEAADIVPVVVTTEERKLTSGSQSSRLIVAPDYSKYVTEPARKRIRLSKGRLFLPHTGQDSFLQHLKEKQQARNTSVPTGLENVDVSKKGSFDQGDPCTTNLFIGHLSPDTDEHSLHLVFGQFGAVASVKIMWPRTEEEHARGHNSGFVSFMHRSDAASALQSLQDTEIDGHVIRLAWGRAVRRVSEPIPPRPGQVYGGTKAFGVDAAMSSSSPVPAELLVQPPTDLILRRDINRLAHFVFKLGPKGHLFEAIVAQKERSSGNQRFSFLWDKRDWEGDDGIYYRWRVYSLASGDTEIRWRTAPFVVCRNSVRWNPPSCMHPINNPEMKVTSDFVLRPAELGASALKDTLKQTDMQHDSDELDAMLTSVAGLDEDLLDESHEVLERILNCIDTSRSSIAHAMCFCIDHSRCAGNVAVAVAQPLAYLKPSSSIDVQRCIGLGFLIADILHNSGSAAVPRASGYRNRFERLLPVAFQSLGLWFRAIDRRLTAHRVAVAFEAVLTSLKRSAIYPADFVDSLRVKLFGEKDRIASLHMAIADIGRKSEPG